MLPKDLLTLSSPSFSPYRVVPDVDVPSGRPQAGPGAAEGSGAGGPSGRP